MQLRQRLGVAAAFGPVIAIALGVGLAAQGPAPAQYISGNPADFGQIAMLTFLSPVREQGQPVPRGQGNWAEVVYATPSWLIVQDQAGRQFPIAYERVRNFYVRWPISAEQLGPNSLIEVTGPQPSADVVIADHVDVFEGNARSLVSPTSAVLGNNNPFPFQFDVVAYNTYGNAFWLSDEEYQMPQRLHLVGPVVATVPTIQSVTIENNRVGVQPSANGMTMTQVTLGDPSVPRPGDLVFIIPDGADYRSLSVQQMVLYKTIPLIAFRP